MIFFLVLFAFSLLGMITLFSVKSWELSHAHKIAPIFRERADKEAVHAKELLLAAQSDFGKLPPLLVHTLHVTLHAAAVDFGHFAHWLGSQAHRLADSVSHKRHFERRETRSEFLKKVSEHKNGGSE